MTERYFDDFEIGEEFVSPGITITESMIVEYALVYDPQPFHLDVAAAQKSNFGGLIASGLQTIALGFRAFMMLGLFRVCSMGSPGMDEIRWMRPVRPGDTLHTVTSVLDKKPSRSKPDRGMLFTQFRIFNQRDEEVASFKCMHLLARRSGGA
ncbi:MAG: MaoC family dehydratase [Rhodospirillales bacterium]|nr:MaoC family dehydratase [Rhodospirillales bacterium]